jgi:hypothetical protein
MALNHILIVDDNPAIRDVISVAPMIPLAPGSHIRCFAANAIATPWGSPVNSYMFEIERF